MQNSFKFSPSSVLIRTLTCAQNTMFYMIQSAMEVSKTIYGHSV